MPGRQMVLWPERLVALKLPQGFKVVGQLVQPPDGQAAFGKLVEETC